MSILIKQFQLRQVLVQTVVRRSFVVSFTLPIDAVVFTTQRNEVVMHLRNDTRI